MKILHLNLKKEYFEEIKNGSKDYEYRLKNGYWSRRLEGREYDEVHFKCGYPQKDDESKIIKRDYQGYVLRDIKHKHFGNDCPSKPQVQVFAILTGN